MERCLEWQRRLKADQSSTGPVSLVVGLICFFFFSPQVSGRRIQMEPREARTDGIGDGTRAEGGWSAAMKCTKAAVDGHWHWERDRQAGRHETQSHDMTYRAQRRGGDGSRKRPSQRMELTRRSSSIVVVVVVVLGLADSWAGRQTGNRSRIILSSRRWMCTVGVVWVGSGRIQGLD